MAWGNRAGKIDFQHLADASGFTDVYTCQNRLDYTCWICTVYCKSLYFNEAVLKICMTLGKLLNLEFTHLWSGNKNSVNFISLLHGLNGILGCQKLNTLPSTWEGLSESSGFFAYYQVVYMLFLATHHWQWIGRGTWTSIVPHKTSHHNRSSVSLLARN